MARLDTPGVGFCKSRSAWAAATAVLLMAGVARAELVDGVQLPDKASKVGERRYRIPQDWEATMKYFRTVYPVATYPRRSIVNQPGVKAMHIANPAGKGWAGLNVYEANDEVRVFVVPPDGVPAKAEEEGAGEEEVVAGFGESSNGRTPDSGSGYLGSNPSSPARIDRSSDTWTRLG